MYHLKYLLEVKYICMCSMVSSSLYFKSFYGMFEYHLQRMWCFLGKYSFSRKFGYDIKHYQKPRTSKINGFNLY